jgi:hypothetical protein
MAELDAELSARLSRLAAAVPVASGQLDVVHRDAVRARQQVRMAWLTPLVVLVVGVVAASALQIGPFAPGATPQPSGPITAATRHGDFTLSMVAEKGTYLEGEPIDISASLSYDGGESTVISHGSGAGGSAIGFGIDEPIFGGARLEPFWGPQCEATTLLRDRPLSVPFEKTTSPVFDPGTSALALFLLDPELRLPPGVWHVYAVAPFRLIGCFDTFGEIETIEMRVELEITVLPRPGETPLPSDANPPEPTTASQPGTTATDRDGDFGLVLEAGKPRYRPDEAIDVRAALTYHGGENAIDFATDSAGPIQFGIREKVFGEIDMGGISLLTCDTSTLRRNEPLVERFQKSGGFSGEHPDAEMFRSWMEDPELRLPEGTWHLWASVSAPCMGGEPAFSLHAEIEIVVDDDPTATPGHPAPTEWADKPVYGGDDIGWAALQLKSEHARYEAGTPIQLSAWYWFMDGQPDMVASHFGPELALSIEQLDVTKLQSLTVLYDTACIDLGKVEGTERRIALGPHNVMSYRAAAVPESAPALFVDDALQLPIGRWRISASVAGTFAPCGQPGEPYAMHTSLEVEVVQQLD